MYARHGTSPPYSRPRCPSCRRRRHHRTFRAVAWAAAATCLGREERQPLIRVARGSPELLPAALGTSALFVPPNHPHPVSLGSAASRCPFSFFVSPWSRLAPRRRRTPASFWMRAGVRVHLNRTAGSDFVLVWITTIEIQHVRKTDSFGSVLLYRGIRGGCFLTSLLRVRGEELTERRTSKKKTKKRVVQS